MAIDVNTCRALSVSTDGPVAPQGSAKSAASFHSGLPSRRQCSAICQRGNGSPGYHLPCPY